MSNAGSWKEYGPGGATGNEIVSIKWNTATGALTIKMKGVVPTGSLIRKRETKTFTCTGNVSGSVSCK
jgi:hypothetical protein